MNYWKRFLFILGLFVLVVISTTMFSSLETKNQDNSFFHGKTADKEIVLEWHIPAEKATLTISKKDKILFTDEVSGTGNHSFSGGKHGEVYIFNLNYIDAKNDDVKLSISRTFLDYKKLPNLETLHINTEDGENPTYEKVLPPEGLWGETIKNNKYKKALLNDNIPLKIRVRGNTSANQIKKPYKLYFNDKIDILKLGDEYADKEWYLLPVNIKTYFGLHLSKFIGMEWEPRMRFVNLMLNGDYRGLYILCESIKPHPKRVQINKKGFLIESDAYFWNKKDLFFESSLLQKQIKFTFKYPEITSKFQPRALAIMKQMKIVEDAIKTNSSRIEDLIDIDTFISRQMSHDFMGTWDSGGSNIFFYKRDMNKGNKLKMGPVWDFDSIFRMNNNEHSRFWYNKTTYFPFLLKNQDFRTAYKQKYFSVAPLIEKEMLSVLNQLKNIPGLEESIKLDAQIWDKQYKSIDTETKELMDHLHKRVIWLNEEISKL